MCSNVRQRLAEISRAIDELAADTQLAAAARPAGAGRADALAADDETAARLAELWAMLADADPQISRKLHHYQD